MKNNKTLRTIQETGKGKNVKSVDLSTGKKTANKKLIALCKKGLLSGYHTVKRKGQAEFLRSDPNKKVKDNLDPIRNLI